MVICLAIEAKVALWKVENLGDWDNLSKYFLRVLASSLVARMSYSITFFTWSKWTWIGEESIGVEMIVEGDINIELLVYKIF